MYQYYLIFVLSFVLVKLTKFKHAENAERVKKPRFLMSVGNIKSNNLGLLT